MKFEVELDAAELNKILNEGLKSLTEEDKHEIIKQAIIKYASDPINVDKCLFETRIDYSGRVDPDYSRPKEGYRRIINELISEEAIKPLRDEISKVIKEHAHQMFKEAMVRSMCSCILTDEFKNSIYNTIINTICAHEEREHR